MDIGSDSPHPESIVVDHRRTFSRAEVWRAWELQGRVCGACRRNIPFDLMHGDHIAPWIRGGRTEFSNLQVLCGSCNLRKGARPQDVPITRFNPDVVAPGNGSLRQWQIEALEVVFPLIAKEPVLVEACPGAGKTRFALELAYRLVVSEAISRVLIVVPTRGIADAWGRAGSPAVPGAPTLPLHTQRDWRSVDPIGDGWLGAVITYQSLFASTEMFLAHATDPGHRTLVVFDEVHHAGANAAWGIAAQEAFAQGARAILSLTGTPFRTNRDPIVFVPSEDGFARPHYSYSYSEAIRDGACRPVQFVETRGETAYRNSDGSVTQVTFSDDLSEREQRNRLRTALEWIGDGSIAAKMIGDANTHLLALRRTGDLDAAGLVVCVDCDHAAEVAAYIQDRIQGSRPIVACSRLQDANDPTPANALRRFMDSHVPWLVAVNMVSEGIDIRRLRVVVYLTNRLTLLVFRQIVGRVVRTDPSNSDDHGRVYIPADPSLVHMAKTVMSEVPQLPPPIVIEVEAPAGGPGADAQGALPHASNFEALGSVGQQGSAFDVTGRAADPDLIELARRFILREGLQGTDPESLAMAALDAPGLLDVLMRLREESV